ncbi:MAG TPA: hypothetical protein VKG82_09395 [Solirubrobacteraceae bacterium]|nr:hypothetical protein [Solirubrobacteraceae bacterium]
MRDLMKLSLPALAASLMLAACGSSSKNATASSAASAPPAAQTSASASSGVIVHTISSPSLGTVLVDARGMTLYELSVEHGGKFICTTSACVAIWHPLLVTSGTPSGVSALGTVKRPDGTLQVTYRGEPLYTFAQDHQPGETTGQGIKDVGTWTVVTASSTPSAGTPTTSSSTPTSTSKSSEPAESSHHGGY